METGAQLFTIRDYCKNLDDFSESLKKIADIGYKNVQVSGTCEFEAEWLKNELKKNGLKCVVTHNSPERLTGETAKIASEHDVFGCKYVGLGWYGFDDEKERKCLEDFIKAYKPVAKRLKQYGKLFMYHNHSTEFKKTDGRVILEHLAEAFDNDEMGFIVDTYWVQNGGGDPAQWIETLSGRAPCIHLKDYAYGAKMAVIGEGNINFERVFEKAESAGTEYMLVEQDDCNGENPFECLKRSYEFLKSRGFE